MIKGKHTCDKCNVVTNSLKTYEEHILTKKHLNNISEEPIFLFRCEKCEKTYNSRRGYSNHKSKCKMETKVETQNEHQDILCELNISHKELKETVFELTNMVQEILQNQKLKKEINDKEIQYIYLLQEREFVNSKEKVFKVGKTRQVNFERFKQYPKGSIILLHSSCLNCDISEHKILDIFRKKFKKRTDIGSEYFEGNADDMKLEINQVLQRYQEI